MIRRIVKGIGIEYVFLHDIEMSLWVIGHVLIYPYNSDWDSPFLSSLGFIWSIQVINIQKRDGKLKGPNLEYIIKEDALR